MLGANMLVHPLLRMDDHIKRAWPTRPILLLPSHGRPFMDEAYTPLWTKRDILVTPSVTPSSIKVVHGKGPSCKFFFFFWCPCHSLIGYQLRRSVFSRWDPRVISGLVRVASYAQVSCLYIVEFLRYPLHLQNFLLWHSSSRASSRSLYVHRLLSSRSRYLLFPRL